MPGAPPPSPNRRVLCDDRGIRIDGDSVRHYHGSPLPRKELLRSSLVTLSDEHRSDELPPHLVAGPPSGEIEPDVVPDEHPEGRPGRCVRHERAAPGNEAENGARPRREAFRSGGRTIPLGGLDEAS
jgi:hypothetical protein